MFNNISVFIVQYQKDKYGLKFKNGITSIRENHIKDTIRFVHGVELANYWSQQIFTIRQKYMTIVKMYLDMEDISYIFLDSEDFQKICDANDKETSSSNMVSYDTPDTVTQDETFGKKVCQLCPMLSASDTG